MDLPESQVPFVVEFPRDAEISRPADPGNKADQISTGQGSAPLADVQEDSAADLLRGFSPKDAHGTQVDPAAGFPPLRPGIDDTFDYQRLFSGKAGNRIVREARLE